MGQFLVFTNCDFSKLYYKYELNKLFIIMSWSDYTNFLLQDGACQTAFILGLNDGLIWASTTNLEKLPNYIFTTEDDDGNCIDYDVNETGALLNAINNEEKFGYVDLKKYPYGLRINNKKLFIASAERENKIISYSSQGGGACIAVTNMTIIIGTFIDSISSAGKCNSIVESLQQLLLDGGY